MQTKRTLVWKLSARAGTDLEWQTNCILACQFLARVGTDLGWYGRMLKGIEVIDNDGDVIITAQGLWSSAKRPLD